MEILVDYDNLDRGTKRAGVFTLCTQLVALLGPRRSQTPERCRVRLYGGWYEGANYTRAAQSISAAIDRDFPQPINWQTKVTSGKCLTQAELAVSLHAEPSRHLFHTFRTRSFCARLTCDTTTFDDCPEEWCPMREVAAFLQDQHCPGRDCWVRQEDVLRKDEQKLIDTMITSDMIFLATKGQTDLVVISSDDDIWPGIRTAVELGARVTLVQTRKRATPTDYTRGVVGLEEVFL